MIMKYDCEVIKDLLPLYADGICSKASEEAVTEHISQCDECKKIYCRLKDDEIIESIKKEEGNIIKRQKSRFKQKSILAGGIIGGIFMIPILVCLIVNIATGNGLDWFFIVLSSLLLGASLTVVPLVAPRYKFVLTLLFSTVTLLLMLMVICLYTSGNWFFLSAGCILFGVSMLLLPIAVNCSPIKEKLKNFKGLTVMAADTVFYILMMVSIGLFVKVPGFFPISTAFSLVPVITAWLAFAVIRYLPFGGFTKTGICSIIISSALAFYEEITGIFFGREFSLPGFDLYRWNINTVDGNVKWSIFIAGAIIGVIFLAVGIVRKGVKK